MLSKQERSCISLPPEVAERIREVTPARGFSSAISLMVESAFEAGLIPTEAEIMERLGEQYARRGQMPKPQSKKFSKERLLSSKPPGEGGAQIVGESSNENFGRGGRALAPVVIEDFGADLEEFGA